MSRKPKHKKATDFQTTMTKSVFLHGRPNLAKREALQKIQTDYTNEVNRFILLIEETAEILPFLVKNDHRSPEVRSIEKDNRSDILT